MRTVLALVALSVFLGGCEVWDKVVEGGCYAHKDQPTCAADAACHWNEAEGACKGTPSTP